MKKTISILALLLLISIYSNAQHSTYYVGHSGFGWDLIVGEMVNDLSTDAGITTYNYGFQFIGGTCISTQWNQHASPQGGTDSWIELAQGYDVVVLAEQIPIQEVIYSHPWGCELTSVEAVDNFHDLAVQGNPNVRIYLMEFHNEVDFTSATPYADWAQLNADMRPLWEQVADSVSLINPGAQVCLIPVAQAFQNLADSVLAGSFPGLTTWGEIFDPSDNAVATIHPTEITYYLVACVHYACIFGQSPVGLTNETFAAAGWTFDTPTPAQALMMQEIAWEVASNDSYSCMPTLSSEELAHQPELEVYPNPSNGAVHCIIPYKEGTISIYNLAGQVIRHRDVSGEQETSFSLEPGVYLVELVGNGESRKKIVVY